LTRQPPKPPTPFSAIKYGNLDFAKLASNREPTPADVMALLAEYKRSGHIATAAKRVNLDYAAAHKAIYDEIQKNPEILDDRQVLLAFGLTLREVSMEAAVAASEKLRNEKLRPNDLVYTSKLAFEKSESLLRDYKESLGAEGSSSADEIAAAMAEKEAELARLKGTGAPPGDAEAQGPAAPDGVPETVDTDN